MRVDRRVGKARANLKSLVLTIILIVIATACAEEEIPKGELHPNVVLIVIDVLRPDHLSAYRYDRPSTSSFDRLADEGARFEAAFSPSPLPIPSIVSLHTALPPEQHGVSGAHFALDGDALTLAEVLGRNGFETAAFIAGAGFPKARGIAQGFQTYVDRPNDDRATRTAQVVSSATEWLDGFRAPKSDAPFFLYVQLDTTDVSSVAAYDASVQSADRAVGQLLEKLDRLGLARDTVVVATASRGHDFENAQNNNPALRDESIHIPLLVRFPPKIDAGKVIPQRARIWDIGSTILMLARVALPEDYGFVHPANRVSMRDLSEMLIGEPRDFDVAMSGELADEVQWFRQDELKVVRYLPRAGENLTVDEYELFNLELDPDERHDIFDQEGRRAELLAEKLMGWREICARRPRYAVPFRDDPS